MNSLNILSSSPKSSDSFVSNKPRKGSTSAVDTGEPDTSNSMDLIDDHTPLLGESRPDQYADVKISSWRAIPKRITSAVIGSIRLVVATISYPIRYLVTCFYDEDDQFSFFLPIITFTRIFFPRKRKIVVPAAATTTTEKPTSSKRPPRRQKKPSNIDEKADQLSSEDSEVTTRRSIRIKLHNTDMLKRQHRMSQDLDNDVDVVAASLKSPSSPISAKLRFPKTPTPPRPLIPRRQPSYQNLVSYGPHAKTLIIDLDETLIHSHSKGGRFATGHMVEVKMHAPVAVGAGGPYLGPQVPILYYVHKRPHCDEFLRKVSKWYNLVIFTASVQEYADPVIDWLELERKYFAARYYRQHCTQRNGAYVKDLSVVEPDLSRVMIVDNSPVSYVFHEDNAIPIEGWISDPTDNDLLNLIPLLEGLQYSTDVRALLALRLGQPAELES